MRTNMRSMGSKSPARPGYEPLVLPTRPPLRLVMYKLHGHTGLSGEAE
jgi:hypothetical protein